MNRLRENVVLFIGSGISYCLLEILWRRTTHWSMAITGGTCFLILYRSYTSFCKRQSLIMKSIIGSGVITAIEFISGCIVNLGLHWDVWDYSRQPWNILGQVCPLYTFLWGILSIPISLFSKKISHKLRTHSAKATQVVQGKTR